MHHKALHSYTCYFDRNSSNDVISTQSQHMTQSQTGDDDALQAFGETRHLLDVCIIKTMHACVHIICA